MHIYAYSCNIYAYLCTYSLVLCICMDMFANATNIYAYLCIFGQCLFIFMHMTRNSTKLHSGPSCCDQGSQGVPSWGIKDSKMTKKYIKKKYGVFDSSLKYFKPVFNKEYRNINTHSDAVPELPHGTVAGSALCAFIYIYIYIYIIFVRLIACSSIFIIKLPIKAHDKC